MRPFFSRILRSHLGTASPDLSRSFFEGSQICVYIEILPPAGHRQCGKGGALWGMLNGTGYGKYDPLAGTPATAVCAEISGSGMSGQKGATTTSRIGRDQSEGMDGELRIQVTNMSLLITIV